MALISIKDFELQIAHEIGDFLSKCTLQFFRENLIEGLVAHCSGVLFTFEEKYFIITAAHCFIDENKDDIKIRVGNTIQELRQTRLVFALESNDIFKDKIDTAILSIENADLIQELKDSHHFIGVEDIALDHKQKGQHSGENLESLLYILFGYPGTQSKLKYRSTKNWNIKALFLHGDLRYPTKDWVVNQGYSNHVFFDKIKKGRKYSSGERVNLPKLKGMSGCGLWDIQGYDIKNNRQKIKLVGIFIEVNFNYAIATKIDLAMEFIRYFFNCEKLPISNHIMKMQKEIK
jgi:hypothetical protein